MKSKDIKKAIAKLLVAAVVMTTAVPAGDVWAGPATLEDGKLTGENPKGINLIFQGDGIGDQYNKHMRYVPGSLDIDIGVSSTDGIRYLPFYNSSGFNRDLGLKTNTETSSEKQANFLFKQDADDITAGEQPGYLYGYKIASWIEDDYGTARKTYGTPTIPARLVNFTAEVVKDTSITLNKVFRISNGLFDDSSTPDVVEAFEEHGAAKSDEAVRKLLTPKAIKKTYKHTYTPPGSSAVNVSTYEDYVYPVGNDTGIAKEYSLGEVIEHEAKVIPGFKLDFDERIYKKYWGIVDSTDSGYGKKFTGEIGDDEAKKVPGNVVYNPDIKQATITTGNTNAELKYRYRYDSNYPVEMVTQNVVYKDISPKDGVADNMTTPIAGTLKTEQSSKKFGEETTVSPDTTYGSIAPMTSVPRYILDKKNPYTITFFGIGETFVGNGFIKATIGTENLVMDQDRNVMRAGTTFENYKGEALSNSTADEAIKSNLKEATPYFEEGEDGGKLNHNLKFYMPNSNLKVVYNWVKNPDYVSGVRVYYKNNSVNLTKEVVELLNTGTTRVTKLDDPNYTNAMVREFRDAATGDADGIEYVLQYDGNGDLDTTKYPGNKLKILAPKLERYHAPNLEQTSGTWNPNTQGYAANALSWVATDISTQTYEISLEADPGKAFFDVSYSPDPTAQFEYLYEGSEGGEIKGPNGQDFVRSTSNPFNTPYSRSVNAHVLFKSDRSGVGAGETYSVRLEKDTDGKILSFFDAVPNLGYELKEWMWDKQAGSQAHYEAVPSFTDTLDVSGIVSADPAGAGQAVVRVKPVFQKIDRMWGNYQFIVDSAKITYTGNELLENFLLENGVDITSNDKTWNDIAVHMDFANNVQIKPGYSGTIQWIDLTDNHVMQNTEIMAGGSTTRVFKAVLEPAASTNVYKVEAHGEMGSDGTTSIKIDEGTNPVTSAFRYIVTDEAGNIVANVTGAQIMANGGVIPPSEVAGGLIPGYKYKVYSAPIGATTPTQIPAVGGSIGGVAAGVLSDASEDIIIPTDAIAATLGLDPNPAHVDKLQITVSPTTAGTKYQLIGPDGSIVNEITPSPAGSPAIFGNLTQGGIYTVVPISTTNPNASVAGHGTPIAIDTDTAPIAVPYKLIITTVEGTPPELVQVGGVTQTIPAPVDGKYIFEGIFKGSKITINFTQWGMSYPQNYPLATVDFSTNVTGLEVRNGKLSQTFDMPQSDLMVTANYMPDGARVATGSNAVKLDTFDGNADADNSSFPGFVGEPLYSDVASPYIYRLHLEKKAADASHVRMVQETNTDKTFQGLFSVKAYVEYKRESDPDTAWSIYDGEVNPIIMTLATNIISADMTKVYGMYEVETSAVAVAGVDDENFHKPSYTNAFTVNGIKNNTDYVFGYFDNNQYPITIKSNRTNVTLSTNALDGTSYQDTLVGFADYQTQLAAEIAMPVIGNDGVTWNFKGLSKSETSFVPVDLNAAITASDVLYIYFENDRVQRADTEVALGSLIAQATPLTSEMRLPKTDRDALQNQINAALGVLNQIAPRKASTAELQAAIDALRTLYEALVRKLGQPILPPPSGGGGGGGGGSSSGGTIKKAATTKSSLTVGVDGNWQLIDANNHTWVFNMNGGNRVNGWNQLTYTYEGKTRTDWYFFNSEGIMMDGWFYDAQNANWYYLSEDHDGFFGRMTLGWYQDRLDGKWYYLDETSGIMRTGWNQLGGEWYYLNPTAPAQTYFYDEVQKKWLYSPNATTRPLGSMYANEATPDGYRVNASGAWVR